MGAPNQNVARRAKRDKNEEKMHADFERRSRRNKILTGTPVKSVESNSAPRRIY